MSGETPSRWASRCAAILAGVVAVALLCSISLPSVAQIHGIPPSVTSIQNHFPPYLPNVPPSVTSLGPHGYVGPPAFPVYPPRFPRPFPRRWGYGHGNNYGYGNGVGYYGYVAPYYPIMDSAYGYDQDGAGPYLYSGPPPEQTLHIVVDMPPSNRGAAREDDDPAVAQSVAPQPKYVAEAPPLDETVLVFRDGHKQQVTNYAIMGQTLYIYDTHTQKISLGDLDIPATMKLNDDSGVEFHLPKPKRT